MSPSRMRPFAWSGWYLTSWFRKEAASSGRWSSASNNAKLNNALRKSCFKWTARRNQFSASSIFLSSIANIPMLKCTRSFLSGEFVFSFGRIELKEREKIGFTFEWRNVFLFIYRDCIFEYLIYFSLAWIFLEAVGNGTVREPFQSFMFMITDTEMEIFENISWEKPLAINRKKIKNILNKRAFLQLSFVIPQEVI